MRKPPVYLMAIAKFNIPDEITQEVGKIIVRYAYLEHRLQTIVWHLAQVTMPIGRLIVREPRAEDRVRLIKDLAKLRGIEVDGKASNALASQAKSIAQSRDLLAHGYWFQDDDAANWYVSLTRGKWSDDEPHHHSKSVVPEALIVTDVALQHIVRQLEAAIEIAEALALQVQLQIEPPPEVPPSQFPHKNPKKDRKP